MSISRSEALIIANEAAVKAADKAIEGVLLRLSVDINDPQAVTTFKESLAFAVRLNKGSALVKSTIVKTCIGALVTGIIALLVFGMKDWINGIR